jgi:ubiquinone/menaquinone biosynthesis C-methylase UbiE
MDKNDHYKITKEFHRIGAVEKNGYYEAVKGRPLKHTVWQLRIRKILLRVLDKLFRSNPDISSSIDAGCGRGDFTIEVANRYSQLSTVYGCDFVREALSIGRKESQSIENISFQQAELINMPYSDNSIDITLCINVIHVIHKDDLEKALSELARITNKYLILEIKNIDNIWFRYIYSNNICGMNIYPNSASEVSNILKKYNFQLLESHGIFLINWLSPLVVLVYKRT